MKKPALVFFCIALPLVILALPTYQHSLFGNYPFQPSPQRAFRIHEIQESYLETTWLLSNRELLNYNQHFPAKLDSLEMFYHTDDPQTWFKYAVSVYQLSPSGRTVASQYYDNDQGYWDLSERAEYTYDTANRLILEKGYDCDNGSQVLLFREHYLYANNQLLETVSWEYDPWDRETEYYKSVLQNDPQGRPLEVINYYSPDSLNWELQWKQTCTYHPNDSSTGLTFIEYFSEQMYEYGYLYSSITPWMWDSFTQLSWDGSAWQNESREVYSWQIPANRLTLITEDMWDDGWYSEYQQTYSYDSNGNNTWRIFWYQNGDNWTEDSRDQYFWESYADADDPAIPTIPSLSLKAYPQPFASSVSILPQSPKAGEVELSIYNLKGQLLQRLKTLPGTSCSWDGRNERGENCANGIYFIKAGQGNTQTSLRIIKLQ